MPKFGKHLKFGLEKFGIYILQDAVSPNTALPQLSTYTQRSKPVVYMPTGKAVSVSLLTTSDGVAKLINQGGILYEGQNVATRALKDALESNLIQYEVQLYIQDNNQRWVDMTERASINGRNMLLKLGSITYTAERLRGQLQQRLSSLSMDNSDGFWDKPFPASLKATLDSDFNEINPVAAVFTETSGGNSSVIYNHKACVRIKYLLTGELIPNILTLGVFIITDINQSGRSRTATLTLSPLSQPLIEADGSSIKKGTSWFQNISVEYLVSAILQKVYGTNQSSLDAGIPRIPQGWTVDTISNITVPLEKNNSWVVSQFGRPTEKLAASNGKVQYTFPNTRATAVKAWEYNTGTVTIDPSSDIITGSSTNWSSTVSSGSMLNTIKVGDSFIISKEYYSGDGGSAKDNDEYYTITEIISSTSIRIDRPPSGSVKETGLKYTIGRLYVGVGPKLYEYNVSSDIYTEIVDLTTTSTAPIRRIDFTQFSDYPIALISISDISYNRSKWRTDETVNPLHGQSSSTSFPIASSSFTYAKAEEFNNTKKNQGRISYLTWDNNWSYSTLSSTGSIKYRRFDFDFTVSSSNNQGDSKDDDNPYPDDYGIASSVTESSSTFPLEIGAVKRQHTDRVMDSTSPNFATTAVGGEDLPIFLPFRTPVYSLCGNSYTGSQGNRRPVLTRFFKREGGEYHENYSTESPDKWDRASGTNSLGRSIKYKDSTLGSNVLFSGTSPTSSTATYRMSPTLEEGVYDSAKNGNAGYAAFTTAAGQTVYDGFLMIMHSVGGRGAFERIPVTYSMANGTKCELFFYGSSKYFNKYSFAMLGQNNTGGLGGNIANGQNKYPPYASQSQWFAMIATEPSGGSATWTTIDFDLIGRTLVNHKDFEDYTPVCSHVDNQGRIYLGLVRHGGEGEITDTTNSVPVTGGRLRDDTYSSNQESNRRFSWAVVAIDLTLNNSASDVSSIISSYTLRVIESGNILQDAAAANTNGNNFANAKVPYEISTTPITNTSATPSSGQLVYVSFWNLSKVGNGVERESNSPGHADHKHELIRYDWDTTSQNVTGKSIDNSQGFLQGLHVIRHAADTSSSSGLRMAYWDSSESKLKGADTYTNTHNVASPNFVNTQLTQLSETTVDTYQFTEPAFFTNSKELYWISSDVPHSLFMNEGEGKYNLTKWSPRAAVRIELADLSSDSCWSVLSQLAELSNCRYGFNPDGTFFFKRKPRNRLSAYTFTDSPTNGQIMNFDKASGYADIANVISKTPYKTSTNESKVSVVLTNDSPYGKIPTDSADLERSTQHQITARTTGSDARKVVVVCTAGGRLKASSDSSSDKDNDADIAKFTFNYITQFTETELIKAYTTSDQDITLREVGDVYLGSTVSAVGFSQIAQNDLSNLRPEIIRTARIGCEAKIGSNSLRVVNNTTGFYANESYIDEHHTSITLENSAGNAVDLSNSLDSPISEPLSRGMVICVRDTSGTSEKIEYMLIEDIATNINTNDTLIVNRAHYSEFPAMPIKAGSSIYIIKKDNKVYLNTPLSTSNDDVFESGALIRIIVPYSGASSTLTSDPFSSTAVQSEYSNFAMFLNAPNWIGGKQGPYSTGMAVLFSSTESENKYPNHSFAKGDRIVVESTGLSLEPDPGSIQTVRNVRSIAQFGEKQRRSVQNAKFLNVNQAYWSALRDLNEYAFPKYTFTLDTIFTPWIDFDSIISIEGQSILPSTSEFKMEAYITQMTLDPQARAMVRLTAKSTSPI